MSTGGERHCLVFLKPDVKNEISSHASRPSCCHKEAVNIHSFLFFVSIFTASCRNTMRQKGLMYITHFYRPLGIFIPKTLAHIKDIWQECIFSLLWQFSFWQYAAANNCIFNGPGSQTGFKPNTAERCILVLFFICQRSCTKTVIS